MSLLAPRPLLVPVALLLAVTGTHAQQVGGVKAQAVPVTLEQMVRSSRDIVVGQVVEQSVRDRPISDGKVKTTIPVYDVTLKLENVLKGSNQPGYTMTFSQWAKTAQPVSVGDELLLYLPPPSSIGLSAPIGIYSGQFKIESTKDSDGREIKTVVNLNNNVGLWSNTKDLLSSSQLLPKSAFQEILEHNLGDKSLFSRNKALEEAALPNTPGPVSLDLLTSVTKTLTEADKK